MSRITFQRCGDCGAVWYFSRGFCPSCGSAGPERLEAEGRGTVHAVTVVTRAPTEALRRYAPYTLLLVDMAEGFRLMAHGEPGLTIGESVRAEFHEFDCATLPRFRRAD